MTQLIILEDHKSFGGRQVKYQHDSKTLKCQMTFQLFLPGDAVDKEIPLFWFLAGMDSSDENFTVKAGMQRLAAKYSLAFVMPDTSPRGEEVADGDDWELGQGASFYVNATEEPWAKNYQMYDYLTKELPEIVYNLVPNFSGQEAILGHSMGGYGALQVGMKNPQRFTSISAFAPMSDPTRAVRGVHCFSHYLGQDRANWKEWDTVDLVKKEGIPPIFISQGTADNFYENNLEADAFLEAAESAGQELTYRFEEGYDHSYYFVSTFLEDHLNFHMEHLKQ